MPLVQCPECRLKIIAAEHTLHYRYRCSRCAARFGPLEDFQIGGPVRLHGASPADSDSSRRRQAAAMVDDPLQRPRINPSNAQRQPPRPRVPSKPAVPQALPKTRVVPFALQVFLGLAGTVVVATGILIALWQFDVIKLDALTSGTANKSINRSAPAGK